MKFWQLHDAFTWWEGLDLDERQWWLTYARTLRPLEAWACHKRLIECGWFGPNDSFADLDGAGDSPERVHSARTCH